MRLLSLLVGAAIVAALVAGCGGGSSSSSGEADEARLSHTEWVSQADAICSVDHEANAGRESEFEALLGGGLTDPKVREEAAELIRAAVPNVETEVKGIRALRPPTADEAEVIRVVGGLERTARLDEKFAEALESGSVHELEAVIAMVGANGERLEALAAELGTKVCGKPHSTAGGEAGGGGGVGDGEADGSRSEWTNQANAICRTNREANLDKLEEFEQLFREGLKTAAERHEGAALIRAGVANVEREIESFRSLTPPLALQADFEKLIAKTKTLVELEGEFAGLLDRGEMQALPTVIGKVGKAELAVRGLALHLGLKACGKLLQAGDAQVIT